MAIHMSEKSDAIMPAAEPRNSSGSTNAAKLENVEDNFEVFKSDGVVNFRTVGWIHASVILLKSASSTGPTRRTDSDAFHLVIFATGVLTIPSSMYVLGALPGAIIVLGWQFINTYCAVIQGNFRNSHAGCHSIGDMAEVVGGVWLREVVGMLFLVSFVIVAASGIFGASVALNALSTHAICTNWFTLVATIAIFLLASVRKFEKIAWLTWVGFASIFTAVFIVV